MKKVRWGIVGCGDVTEIKSGPGFQKARDSELTMVMRRNGDLARDYARRHGVARWTDDAAELIGHPEVDAVYIATPPNAHSDYALMCAAAGKPALVEKPIATHYEEGAVIVEAFRAAGVPLFVAYYRRAMPHFLKVKQVLDEGTIGAPRTVHISHFERPAQPGPGGALNWRVDPTVGGGGIFVDIGCHALDFLDYLFGPVAEVAGFAANRAGLYAAEDLVSAAFTFENGVLGSGEWCFTAHRAFEQTRIVGTEGEVAFSFYAPHPIVVTTAGGVQEFAIGFPPHVHQPLIQTAVDHLLGRGQCPSTGETGIRATRVIDIVLRAYGERIK
ncbi:Gfo/Idh/MocA family protein [Shumkonia mesophila]|uniref:Gfo/Idh/MocA family protein n=1 Tax=Shumkonia mesophila TaxID=2838854 RepID=UPI0029344E0D|nr:Gfo/Idh/MocA family oxidoreductase [Shumkonia mesophila]